VFVGVSAPHVIDGDDVARMAPDAIVFALANPVPEIDPGVARQHAAVVATGRSDYPNQINNVLAFPGVFRGALDARATTITPGMREAAAVALAATIAPGELSADYIIPSVFNRTVAPAIAAAVQQAAEQDGVARRRHTGREDLSLA
jgi:malate dehydrogenase (oxaloacetate-decarboxylating)